MPNKVTLRDITPGTVVTFTRDLTFLNDRWKSRRPGIHFVVDGVSPSGYMFSALNTATGRRDAMMAEEWVFDALRVVGRITDDAPECTCDTSL